MPYADPEKAREAARERKRKQRANPGAIAAEKERTAELREARGDLDPSQVVDEEAFSKMLERSGFRCFWCRGKGLRSQFVQCLLTPTTAGGRRTANNVVPACEPCTGAKGNLSAAEYLELREKRRAAGSLPPPLQPIPIAPQHKVGEREVPGGWYWVNDDKRPRRFRPAMTVDDIEVDFVDGPPFCDITKRRFADLDRVRPVPRRYDPKDLLT